MAKWSTRKQQGIADVDQVIGIEEKVFRVKPLGKSIGIKPLKARQNVTKLDLIIPLLSILVYLHWFNHSTHISYIVHDLDALRVVLKIQVMGSF